jgi:hypothetical protein
MKNEYTTGAISLGELLEQPPTIVVYRPDGQLSLDMLPGMTTPDAVVCFRSMLEARRFLASGRRLRRKRAKGFRAVRLPTEHWLEAVKAEAEKGRTHLAIFHLPNNGQLEKTGIKIAELLSALEKATDEYLRATESWRWN